MKLKFDFKSNAGKMVAKLKWYDGDDQQAKPNQLRIIERERELNKA